VADVAAIRVAIKVEPMMVAIVEVEVVIKVVEEDKVVEEIIEIETDHLPHQMLVIIREPSAEVLET
jgi:hypothetical protein